jgi:signal transduction histidine kinase
LRRRLILSTALISLAAVIVLGVPLALVEAARVRQDTTSRLEREADAAAGAVDDLLEANRVISPALLARYAPAHHRIAVTTLGGRTIQTGPPLRGAVLRAHAGTAPRGSVVAEASTRELDDRIHRVWLLIAALGAGGVVIATGLAALQARRLARPLEAIARRSAQLGDGDFSVRAGHFGVPEIDAIAQGLDSSAGRIAELVAREREFSANVSHQLRTPLTALRLRIEEAGHGDDAGERARELEAALVEADRLEATIADLLAHARQARNGGRIAMNLGAVAHEHAGTWRPVFARAGRSLEVVAAKNVVAYASRGTVGQVLDVLLDNALRHGGGTVRITVADDARAATMIVSDGGAGVAEADRERIFERGASRTGGTGIGLHLARTLVEGDGGALHLVRDGPAGFELRLPVTEPRR